MIKKYAKIALSCLQWAQAGQLVGVDNVEACK